MDLASLYPWPEGPWLRSMMVMTLDGATVGADGLSGSISGPADKRVFMEARRLADVVLVGAGTIRAERYRPMIAKPEWQEVREAVGLAPAPRIVVVSGRLDLPWDEAMFTDSTFPVMVATTTKVDADRLELACRHAEVVQLGEDTVDLHALVTLLREGGASRIVCEGGEALLDALVQADLVDEMDLSISPVFAGGGHLPDAARTVRAPYSRFSLAHQFMDEGFVFCRFVR